jgi:penicillin-binding protein 2
MDSRVRDVADWSANHDDLSQPASERAGLRLLGLALAMVCPLALIALRFAHVQLTLGDEYRGEFEQTYERFEPIPSRDGRLLAVEGTVLAEDVDLFRLKVHYRWLEAPADPGWLRSLALRRLDRRARRNAELVAQAEAEVEREREALWRRLAERSGVEEAELARRRERIQRRVERLQSRVAAQRDRNEAAERRTLETPPNPDEPWWSRCHRVVVTTLTTPPRREAREPVVIQEQLDYHVVVDQLTADAAVEIEGHPELFPGVRLEAIPQRVYPQGDLAPHLLGVRQPVSDEFLAERRARFPQGDPLDYQPGDRAGLNGLERQYEHRLRGLRGSRRLVFNRRGELLDSQVVRAPRLGQDVQLGLSVELQRAAEELLDAALTGPQKDETNGKSLPTPKGGSIVALDVRTGAVLAAASGPRFDPAVLVNHDAAGWRAIVDDPRRPLFHRAAEMTLPPGSVFKIVSSIGFLESGQLDPEEPLTCLGYLDSPERYRCYTFKHHGVGHGDVNLVSAMARSCNVYFFSAARRIGADPILTWADRFGLGQPTGVDLPIEQTGSLPREERRGQARGKARSSGEALQLAIGQGRVTATPLQVARLMAAVANGGRLVTPHCAIETREPGGNRPEPGTSEPNAGETVERISGLSSRTLAFVRRGLEQVVEHPQGTGYKTVRSRSVRTAGKTGTAEPGGGRPDHAWFAGYVPAQRPRVAFVVVLEHAGPGGHAAGPVARKLVEALERLDLLGQPSTAPDSTSPSAN